MFIDISKTLVGKQIGYSSSQSAVCIFTCSVVATTQKIEPVPSSCKLLHLLSQTLRSRFKYMNLICNLFEMSFADLRQMQQIIFDMIFLRYSKKSNCGEEFQLREIILGNTYLHE